MTEKTDINLAELSDEEIATLDPDTLVSAQESDTEASQSSETDEAQSAASAAEEDNATDDTGGAGSEEGSSEVGDGGADTASAESDTDSGTEDQSAGEDESTREPYQGEGDDSDGSTATGDSTTDVDYKAEFAKVMAPLKAARRTVTPTNAEEVRRLMQMGVDYSRKMEQMKPYQKVLKTLERNDLLDMDKVNFLIDVQARNPEAIKKLLKDSEIDPMDLDLEDNTDYRPTDHMVSDQELSIENVIDSIRGTTTFDQTVDVITKQWDNASRQLLIDNPQVIRFINDHIEGGIYDKIMDRLESDRVFGKHVGLSDLEAYKAVGDAMQAEGAFGTPTPNESASSGNTDQGHSQDPSGSGPTRKDRKKAASPPKGTASARKQAKPNFFGMSDEEIENFDVSSL